MFSNTSHLRRTFLWPSAVESDDKDGTVDLDIQHAKWLLLQSVSKQGQPGRQTIWASVRWTLMEGPEERSPWRVQHCHHGRVIKIFHWLECSHRVSVVVYRWRSQYHHFHLHSEILGCVPEVQLHRSWSQGPLLSTRDTIFQNTYKHKYKIVIVNSDIRWRSVFLAWFEGG